MNQLNSKLILTVITIFFFLFHTSPQLVSAQFATCSWVDQGVDCITNTSCPAGYLPENDCSQYSQSLCNYVAIPCRLDAGPTNPHLEYCGNSPQSGIVTALGCFPTAPLTFINTILVWSISLGGLASFIMIVYAGFILASASGDPKKIEHAKELLFSALAGMVLIVLSVIIVNFIGIDILNLSNLGFGA